MKTLTQILLVALIASFSFGCAQSQDTSEEQMMEEEMMSSGIQFSEAHARSNNQARPSPNAAVMQTIGTTNISITYGRPGVKGRTIFGDLEAFGEIWRVGANESTVVTFPTDVTVEGQPLEAGTYSLYSVPGEDTWTIVFNSKLSWGTQYDENQDVLRVDVESETAPSMEQFMIYFQNVTNSSAEVVLHWDETKVPFTVEV